MEVQTMQVQGPGVNASTLTFGETAVRLDNGTLVLCLNGVPPGGPAAIGCADLATGNMSWLNANSQVVVLPYKAVPV